MTENIDFNLPEHLQNTVQPRVLGLIQEEIGVLTTNLFSERAMNEALRAQRIQDVKMIDALKRRAFTAEENVRILQAQFVEQRERAEKSEQALKRAKNNRKNEHKR